MVSIHRSYTVIPSEMTPPLTLPLSLCDQIKLPKHGAQLYLYTSKRNNDDSSLSSCIHILRTSLSKALIHYYPFAGRLRWIEGGQLELLCNAKGALLLEATSDEASLDDLADVVQKQKLVPKIDHDVPIEDVPLLVVQLTKLRCGALTLAVSFCRALVDGTAVWSFMTMWAKIARGESLDSSLMPLIDPTLLDSRSLQKPPRFQHPEFSPPPLWEGSSGKDIKVRPQQVTAILKLTKDQVEKLKNKANDNKKKKKVRRYTSLEVISGHLWRCVCKVRHAGNGNQPTRLATLVNCRNRLSPPLPRAYFGHATFPTVTPTCSFDEVVHKPLSYAAGKVREATERITDEYIRSALDCIANEKDMNLLRDAYYFFEGREGQFRENPNLYVVGWTNFPYYATNFGWGKPDYMVPGNINYEGEAIIIDARSGDGFIVVICLQPSHIDALKKLFYEDIEPIVSKL